jgi:hypothetical protein
MQDIKRLKVGAVLGNSPQGILSLQVVPFDGGDFGLVAKRTDNGVVLVDPNRPASYGIEIAGDSESLKQLANALLAVARGNKSDDADTDGDA